MEGCGAVARERAIQNLIRKLWDTECSPAEQMLSESNLYYYLFPFMCRPKEEIKDDRGLLHEEGI